MTRREFSDTSQDFATHLYAPTVRDTYCHVPDRLQVAVSIPIEFAEDRAHSSGSMCRYTRGHDNVTPESSEISMSYKNFPIFSEYNGIASIIIVLNEL